MARRFRKGEYEEIPADEAAAALADAEERARKVRAQMLVLEATQAIAQAAPLEERISALEDAVSALIATRKSPPKVLRDAVSFWESIREAEAEFRAAADENRDADTEKVVAVRERNPRRTS